MEIHLNINQIEKDVIIASHLSYAITSRYTVEDLEDGLTASYTITITVDRLRGQYSHSSMIEHW